MHRLDGDIYTTAGIVALSIMFAVFFDKNSVRPYTFIHYILLYVAKIFRDILRKNGWSFQKVIFAIPDYRRYGNYNKFRKVIKEK